MIHPVSGLIVWVYGVFVANLFGPVSLLVHVGSANQFGTKVPALSSWQLNVHSYIVIGFLKVFKKTQKRFWLHSNHPYEAITIFKWKIFQTNIPEQSGKSSASKTLKYKSHLWCLHIIFTDRSFSIHMVWLVAIICNVTTVLTQNKKNKSCHD